MSRWTLLALLLFSLSCNSNNLRIVKVKVLYDPQAKFQTVIATKLQKVRDQKLMTSERANIDIHEAAPGANTFHRIIAGTGGVPLHDFDIVVLDPNQPDLSNTVKQALNSSRNACAPQATCMAFVGSWISGERKEATEQVFAELTK